MLSGDQLNAYEALSFLRRNGGTLTLRIEALEQMRRHRQLGARDREACGVLLGRFFDESQRVIVEAVTEPQPADQRTRTRFVRSNMHQALVEQVFEASAGACVYTGEWHTHPEPTPWPSSRDRVAWFEKLMDSRIIVDTLFFIIVGTRDLAVWEGDTATRTIQQLTYVTPHEPTDETVNEGTSHA